MRDTQSKYFQVINHKTLFSEILTYMYVYSFLLINNTNIYFKMTIRYQNTRFS